jgi:hypothetical protein
MSFPATRIVLYLRKTFRCYEKTLKDHEEKQEALKRACG